MAAPSPLHRVASAWPLLALSALACAGRITDADNGAAGPPGPSSAEVPGTAPGAAAPGPRALPDQPGPMPLRRLTRSELNNTLRDLLGDGSSPARTLPPEGKGLHGFLEAGIVTSLDVEGLQDMVERVVAAAAPKLPGLAACDPAASGEEACVQRFVTSFGRRAFRRPLAADEVARYVDTFRSAKSTLGYGFADATRLVLEAMLLAPSFLYHWELGPQRPTAQANLVRLTPYETAARLSYFLWGSMPDDALAAAAEGGRLATDADIEREARRLLADARARPTVIEFFNEWLTLDKLFEAQKDPKSYPAWNVDLARAMADETTEFAWRTILQGDGSWRTLLTSPASYLNANLAKLYGVAGPADAKLVRTALDPAQRAGLFTHASFLTVNATALGSHPVKRGHKIFQDVLCGTVGAPPATVPQVEPPPPSLSMREAFEVHDRNPCAEACHALFDPLGFAFENYDAIGRYRKTDGGKPVDASGTLEPPSGQPARPFRNAVELVGALASLDEVQACAARQWFRFALARPEVDGDRASIERAIVAFRDSGLDVRELLVGIARARAFSYRTPSEGEVLR